MIDITKTGTGQARVTVNGQTYTARMDSATKRWVVSTPAGDRFTSSPKLHSIGKLFGQPVQINGGAPKAPRAPRAPRMPRGRGARRHAFGQAAKAGPAFTAPKPSRRDMLLVALASLEDAFVVKLSETGVTDDVRKSYDRYKKLKALALGATSTPQAANEAYAALRMSVIEVLKLAF
jgi:hypothetical protein